MGPHTDKINSRQYSGLPFEVHAGRSKDLGEVFFFFKVVRGYLSDGRSESIPAVREWI